MRKCETGFTIYTHLTFLTLSTLSARISPLLNMYPFVVMINHGVFAETVQILNYITSITSSPGAVSKCMNEKMERENLSILSRIIISY